MFSIQYFSWIGSVMILFLWNKIRQQKTKNLEYFSCIETDWFIAKCIKVNIGYCQWERKEILLY